MINDLDVDIPTVKFVDDTTDFDISDVHNGLIQKAANDIAN